MKLHRVDLGLCEVCRDPAKAIIGRGSNFPVCARHRQQLWRRFRERCQQMTRIQLRKAMGFVYPDERDVPLSPGEE